MNNETVGALTFLLANEPAVASNRQMSEWFQHRTRSELEHVVLSLTQSLQQLADPEYCQRLERAVPYMAESSRREPGATQEFLDAIAVLYLNTPEPANLRNGWLYWLAVIGTPPALVVWRRLVATTPPQNRQGMIWPVAPLLKKSDWQTGELLDILDTCLPFPLLASTALDLVNYQFREGLTRPHVAAARVPQLTELTGKVAQQLALIEEGRIPPHLSPEAIAETVQDSVALLISLCDLLALTDAQPAEGKLRQVADLKHRRVKLEAWAALARLGREDAKQEVTKLAHEASLRARAISYAQELGILSDIPESFRTPAAQAEGQLANWLAAPEQMGIAPSHVEVIDERRQFWPGYDDPIDCYLVRFNYGSEPQQFSNIGIVGPLTYAFEIDVTKLSVGDLYAAFAGWQASHEELYEVAWAEAVKLRGREIDYQLKRLDEHQFANVAPQFAAHFFGEWLLIARASLHDRRGTVIVDDHDVHWFVDAGPQTEPEFAYLVYRGRRLLQTFNPQDDE